jgi:hypothetical protein
VTEPDPTNLPAVAAKLITTIDGLTAAINDLLRRTARSERFIAFTVAGLVLDLGLTIVAGFLMYSQYSTNATLEDTRGEVLCPLYSVFLGSYNPSTRSPGTDRKTYEDTFQVIRDGYQHLGCTSPLVPPATPHAAPPK